MIYPGRFGVDRIALPSVGDFPPSRITMICGGLEEGRDGVGDYCRYLAATLSARSITCDLISLNDPSISSLVESTIPSHGAKVNLLRIPSTLPRVDRARMARSALARWKPDWVSLQLVPTGLAPRGIIVGGTEWLVQLLRPYPLHVMMHELWLDYRLRDSLKYFLLGRIQRYFLLRLLSRLRPKLVHTSNAVYQRMLGEHGIKAKILPLFSSVPVTEDKADWLDSIVRSASPDRLETTASRWIFGFFGGISPTWEEAPLFGRLIELGRKHQRDIVVVSIGNSGTHGADMMARWKKRFPSMVFIRLGYRSADQISQFLNTIDIGLTSYPAYVLGKSSAAATVLAHGVPVIASWGDFAPELPAVSEHYRHLVWKNDDLLEQRLLSPPPRHRLFDTPSQIAKELLDALQSSMTYP